MTRTVYSSTKVPNIKPMTSIGTPALPCLSIFRSASEEMCTVSLLSTRAPSAPAPAAPLPLI
ncbi:MAG: hypothetical protein Q8P67_20680 [archaeon]|nr:hypothetical protein [archaeon]